MSKVDNILIIDQIIWTKDITNGTRTALNGSSEAIVGQTLARTLSLIKGVIVTPLNKFNINKTQECWICLYITHRLRMSRFG